MSAIMHDFRERERDERDSTRIRSLHIQTVTEGIQVLSTFVSFAEIR